MSITAFLENSLILISLHKESSLHLPSKLLLRSLAITDLFVGLIAEPVYVTYCMSIANEHWNMFRYTSAVAFTTAFIFCGVSVLTLTAISVDRLLALLLGLRYKQVVTLKRTYLIVIGIWVVWTFSSAILLWKRQLALWYCGIIGTSLCLVISIFSYTKIFFTLRHHQNQVQGHVQQPNQTNQLNITRYKRQFPLQYGCNWRWSLVFYPLIIDAQRWRSLKENFALKTVRTYFTVNIYFFNLNFSLNSCLT